MHNADVQPILPSVVLYNSGEAVQDIQFIFESSLRHDLRRIEIGSHGAAVWCLCRLFCTSGGSILTLRLEGCALVSVTAVQRRRSGNLLTLSTHGAFLL